jgi:hypothetical protein
MVGCSSLEKDERARCNKQGHAASPTKGRVGLGRYGVHSSRHHHYILVTHARSLEWPDLACYIEKALMSTVVDELGSTYGVRMFVACSPSQAKLADADHIE